MVTHPANKYHLKELHQEIDYFDRKISYAQTLEKFASDADRDAAIKKLHLKRDRLAKAARDLADNGVEWEAKDLPRSFVNSDREDAAAEGAASDGVVNSQ
jgi:heme oxygenase